MDENGRWLDPRTSEDVPDNIGNTPDGPFTVSARGPSGSGRHWDMGVSFELSDGRYGFCLLTSTVGWRHVGPNHDLAAALIPLIRQVQDVDGDGSSELVVPTSTALSDSGSLGDYAMSAVAYDRRGEVFVPDTSSSRILQRRIAHAYREAAESSQITEEFREHYLRAAALETNPTR